MAAGDASCYVPHKPTSETDNHCRAAYCICTAMQVCAGSSSTPTGVPGLDQLHPQAGGGVAKRQDEAQGVDAQVQPPPLHRHDVQLLQQVKGGGARGSGQGQQGHAPPGTVRQLM